ncbi:MAG: VOC family protein [Proteobacteria bacterium]|nr:VOC family protein [Pseudomonadota bacterium]
MLVDKLEHYNIVTEKLDETVAFYVEVVGLENGHRPNFAFPGAWLYAGEEPVVHLMQLGETREGGSGAIDHVAFRGGDYAGYKTHLEAKGIAYDERFVPDAAMHQLFITDPNGVKVEINFRQQS